MRRCVGLFDVWSDDRTGRSNPAGNCANYRSLAARTAISSLLTTTAMPRCAMPKACGGPNAMSWLSIRCRRNGRATCSRPDRMDRIGALAKDTASTPIAASAAELDSLWKGKRGSSSASRQELCTSCGQHQKLPTVVVGAALPRKRSNNLRRYWPCRVPGADPRRHGCRQIVASLPLASNETHHHRRDQLKAMERPSELSKRGFWSTVCSQPALARSARNPLS